MNVKLQWTYCFKRICLSIDQVVIKYLISMKRKIYSIDKEDNKLFLMFCLFHIIMCRGNESLCCLLSTKYAMRIASLYQDVHGLYTQWD